jgi:hypothetical protein
LRKVENGLPDLGISIPYHGISIPDRGISIPYHGISIPYHGISFPDCRGGVLGLEKPIPDYWIPFPDPVRD